MNVVPEDLVEAVHRAARAIPPYAADLTHVHRRVRARRRHRTASAAGGLAVLVALTGGAVPLLTGALETPPPVAAPSPTPAPPSPTAVATRPAPAQRLIILGYGSSWQADGGPEVGLVGGVADEVLPDGTVQRHRVPDGWEQTVALSDGRLVGLQLRDLMPGVPRRDGPDVEGLSIKLVVLTADGRVQRSREVRVKGGTVELVGADERIAYLARDVGLVAHDLATGAERILLRSSKVGVDLRQAQLDVRAGLVAVHDDLGRGACRIDVLALADGRRQGRVSRPEDCEFRLSPDGRRIAVTYRRPLAGTARRHQHRVAVHDVRSGTLLTDQLIGTTRPGIEPVRGGTWGTAWTDNTTLRVVWAELPADAQRIYSVGEVVKVVTVRVQ